MNLNYNNVLDVWETTADNSGQEIVIPDGCCDLIFKFRAGQEPVWFLSDLAETSQTVPVFKGDYFRGYRLRPGTNVQTNELLKLVSGKLPSDGKIPEKITGINLSEDVVQKDNIIDLINTYTAHRVQTEDALQCLASGIATIERAASELGVSSRTLQRYIVKETGKTPVFWHRLSRVRRAGRDIINAGSLAEFAFDYGFSDQAHMTREFRQWFGLSPRTFAEVSRQQEIFQTGYG